MTAKDRAKRNFGIRLGRYVNVSTALAYDLSLGEFTTPRLTRELVIAEQTLNQIANGTTWIVFTHPAVHLQKWYRQVHSLYSHSPIDDRPDMHQ